MAEKPDNGKKAGAPEAPEKTKASEDVVVKEEGAGDKSDLEKATGKEEKEKEEKKDRHCALQKGKDSLNGKVSKSSAGIARGKKGKR